MGRQVARYQRDDQEFGRAIGFFDATYALRPHPVAYLAAPIIAQLCWLLIIPIRVAARRWAG